ncbi:protein O-linked-mannose beta-1,2-N-acetylglucosaminyltransferase 1-like isoform X1 [Portunus trituberculatus]|uniref:protein O-linked-mannose beta-1,2-N-acetylglucosaminyltransferase 1-like isoform X1 n=1 Tax=Portunus trituberculatus TaxID=210409 RepID=UPI001E1CB744|nr:protein O-linked-mannose beta-1,2-N-acetylglucosaminyltransferase 1-like isoform X1 [Portunus trituberculatus]
MAGVEVWSGDGGWGLEVRAACLQDTDFTTRCEAGERHLQREGWTVPLVTPSNASISSGGPRSGIALTAVNPRTGRVIFNKVTFLSLAFERHTPSSKSIHHRLTHIGCASLPQVFPLGQYWAHWADLEWHLQHVAPGRVVVLAIAVSGAVGLRHAAVRLAALGSLFAFHLPPTAHWTWVFIKGGRTLSETVTLHSRGTHHAHLLLPLSSLPYPPFSEPRWHYCATHGVMGGLCDEHDPDPLPPPKPAPVARQAALAHVPIIVTAGARHQYLYYTLTTLLAAPGALHHNVLVVLGDAPPSTTSLLHLLGLNFTTVAVSGRDNEKLFRYYRAVFRLLERSFPDAPAAILLDEDVEVSPDFFSFFSQTLWLLHADPSLYCINAYSATGFSGIAHDARTLQRGSVQVEWGYAVSLDFVRDVNTKWPNELPENDTLFYDEWIFRHGGRGRECVFPEMSRTKHFGVGVNTDAWSTEIYFLNKPVMRRPHVALQNVAGMVSGPWQRRFSASLASATPLTGNPCGENFVPRINISTNFVFFYKQVRKPDGQPDWSNFYFAAKCLNAWGVSAQGLHQHVLTVRPSLHTTLFLVGTPFSPHGHLCPPHVTPWQYATLTSSEDQILIDRIRHLEIGEFHVANLNVTTDYLAHLLIQPRLQRQASDGRRRAFT